MYRDLTPIALSLTAGGLRQVAVESPKQALGALHAQRDTDEHALSSSGSKLMAGWG